MWPVVGRSLARLAATGRWAQVQTALSRSTGIIFKSVDDFVQWARQHKAGAAILASALVEAGISVVDLLKGEDKKSNEVKEAASALSTFVGVTPELATKLSEILAGDGDGLSASRADDATDRLARVATAYVKTRVLGAGATPEEVLEYHAATQLFAHLSRASLVSMLRDVVSPLPQYSSERMRAVLLAGA